VEDSKHEDNSGPARDALAAVVNIEVNLADGLDTDAVERVTDEVRARIEKAVPQARHIQVEVEGL
jgi:divalent metal cation (Fe/Co/Zn/Cd) transporter